MLTVKGSFNEAKIFTDNVEQGAIGQIIELCNQEFVKSSKIRIMPDTHAGKGCTIGTTMTIQDKIVPNLVGVDIGCGMETITVSQKEIDFQKLDAVIRKHVPSGFSIRNNKHEFVKKVDFSKLYCFKELNETRTKLSLGSLGGGNHFIECNADEDGNIYFVIHSGSRNLGKVVAEFYQKKAYELLKSQSENRSKVIQQLRDEGREKEIEAALKSLPSQYIPKDLAYLEGVWFDRYMHDMAIAQEYALWNRKAMMDEIVKNMDLTVVEQFTTVHNYIDIENMILRKGAISAQKGEKVLIPINMRDGSLIAIGKGNPDWNYSAPHGAGRILSRSKAKATLSLDEFKETMKDVWSTSVLESTLDESPMAYKEMKEIIENTKDAIEVIKVIKPLYNFKAN
ncbi:MULTISPECIES: RtcB family protein [Bacillaceae]|uniref:RtcB family protein n=1 Tax=Bacillaceae TaxID=186817 RepID=UPI000BED1966|nr:MULTISPECIES: RtcB family protein [unclassified Bacillus (in: firmicutes)]PEC51545.1 RNA-splicing ligase RtcB [Bacillus sp. AFS096315]PFM78659.1 RNA-splicing ligase RtcB [Bacillus sp. AFS077874]